MGRGLLWTQLWAPWKMEDKHAIHIYRWFLWVNSHLFHRTLSYVTQFHLLYICVKCSLGICHKKNVSVWSLQSLIGMAAVLMSKVASLYSHQDQRKSCPAIPTCSCITMLHMSMGSIGKKSTIYRKVFFAYTFWCAQEKGIVWTGPYKKNSALESKIF